MCLLVVLSRVLPDWPLVVAANRDEFYERPASPLGVLRDRGPRTLGGRDLQAGGTALAVNEHGVVAGLTNKPLSGGRDGSKRSRGEIPLALTETDTARGAVSRFLETYAPGAFNPCWVLVGDRSTLYYLDMTVPGEVRPVELAPGVHVLENRPLVEPSAKVDHVLRALGDVGSRTGDEVLDALRGLLADHAITRGADGDTDEAQLVSRASACCVHAGFYGTRSAMLIRDPRSAGELPEVCGSDGPSCTNPLRRIGFPASGAALSAP